MGPLPAMRSGGLASRPVTQRLVVGAIALSAVLIVLLLVAVSVGPVDISFGKSLTAVLEAVGIGDSVATDIEQTVVERIRLPRIILAIAVGAALGVAGATMQGLFRNPLADPGIIGVSAGGALGAVIAIVTGAHAATTLSLPAAAFAGALAAMLLVYGIASVGGRPSMASLLLAGVAVASFLGACISAVIYFTTAQGVQREIIFWLAGGLDASSWQDVRLAAPPIFAGIGVALLLARDLNLLTLGDDEAASLGVRVGLSRITLIVAVTLATGAAVAFSGTIAFVGLVVPHALRLVVGPDHRVLLPLSALGGAVFLLAADTIARTITAPVEVRVGIITAFIGAPFFLILLVRNKARAEAL